MKPVANSFPLAFSLCTHGLLLAGMLLLAHTQTVSKEKVYRVALAELAPAPSQPQAPAAVETPAPLPEPTPKVEDTPAKPAPEIPKADVKKISPKKSDTPIKKPQPVAPPVQPNPQPAPQTAPAGPQARNIGGLNAYETDVLDQRPGITRRVEPEYPAKARRMNIQGKVAVQMVIDTSGMPRKCSIVRADPPGYFEDAAIAAASSMRFTPGKLKGQPVNTLVLLPFTFRLR